MHYWYNCHILLSIPVNLLLCLIYKLNFILLFFSHQLCPTLCDPMDCSTPSLAVCHYLQEFAQVHVHCISDGIQPSHILTPSSPSALDLSQHQGFFQWVICSHQITKTLELQHQSFQSKGLSGVFSSTTVRRHQFSGVLSSLWFSPHNHKWPLVRPQPWLYGPLSAEKCLCFSTETFV